MKRSKRNGKILIKNIIMLFFIFSIIGIFINFSNAKEDIILKEYEVNKNDTLWDISSNICKKSDRDDLNVQSIIKEIKNINNLENNNIYEGQVINLPVY